MAKPGPRPSPYAMLRVKGIRLRDDLYQMSNEAGDSDFWRAVIERVSKFKIQADTDQITPDQLKEQVGEELAEIFYSGEPGK